MSFSKNNLETLKEFKTVFQSGRSYFSENLGIKTLKNGLPITRIGFSVGKKHFSKATDRNKLKRQLKSTVLEIAKKNEIKSGFDVVVFSAKPATDGQLKYSEIEKQTKILFNKSNLIYYSDYRSE